MLYCVILKFVAHDSIFSHILDQRISKYNLLTYMPSRKNIFSLKNIALVILGVFVFILAHLIFNMHFSPVRLRYSQPPSIEIIQSPTIHGTGTLVANARPTREGWSLTTADTRPILDDPYNPPLVFPESGRKEPVVSGKSPTKGGVTFGGVPINVRTRGIPDEYRQLGLLTRNSGPKTGDKMILPLMGRNLHTGRDKWQYYTMSNSPGTISTRLPVSVDGRSCSSEYGCDSVSNGDVVYVDGYDETFRVTLYETGLFSYLSNI